MSKHKASEKEAQLARVVKMYEREREIQLITWRDVSCLTRKKRNQQ